MDIFVRIFGPVMGYLIINWIAENRRKLFGGGGVTAGVVAGVGPETLFDRLTANLAASLSGFPLVGPEIAALPPTAFWCIAAIIVILALWGIIALVRRIGFLVTVLGLLGFFAVRSMLA